MHRRSGRGGSDARATITTAVCHHCANSPGRAFRRFSRSSGQSLGECHSPPAMIPYLRFAWPALGVVVLLGIGVSVWQVRRDTLASSSTPPARQQGSVPAPVPMPPQPQNTPSPYQSCVLSYATEDQAFAEKLYADLQSNGVSCWFAPHDLKIGDKLRDKIYKVAPTPWVEPKRRGPQPKQATKHVGSAQECRRALRVRPLLRLRKGVLCPTTG
jgi:hypothetical protein